MYKKYRALNKITQLRLLRTGLEIKKNRDERKITNNIRVKHLSRDKMYRE